MQKYTLQARAILQRVAVQDAASNSGKSLSARASTRSIHDYQPLTACMLLRKELRVLRDLSFCNNEYTAFSTM